MKVSRQPLLSTPDLHAALKAGQVKPGRKEYAGVVKKDGEGDAAPLSFVMTTEDKDRYGDVIKADGWQVANFLKNPVLLWAHFYGMPPVGKVGSVELTKGALVARNLSFVPREVDPFAWSVEQMIRGGFLNAVSVGFLPTEYEWDDDERGYVFTQQELLELSVVPVPANPNALLEAKSAGLWLPAHEEWCEKMLALKKDGADPFSRPAIELAEQAWQVLRAPQVQVPAADAGDDELPELKDLAIALRENTAAQLRVAELLEKTLSADVRSEEPTVNGERVAQLVKQHLRES